VCHQTQEEMEASRKTFRTDNPVPSPYRNRSIEENLNLFELMRKGYFAEGEACLRMKGDYCSNNPNMWDHVAYRIIYKPHPHVGDKWCIYPTYDYTHCIIDSLEWVTASCCTLEFENRRESYFWLLDVLQLYKPVVWEYSRLNLTYNVLSKRKLLKLVQGGYVRGWDDPRMLTINGLRRRGYTAEILRYFCDKIGVTRKNNFISPKLLEACARELLNEQSPRAFGVLSPLKITLTNFNKSELIECPDFPQKKDTTKHSVPFERVIYIDSSDFREHADQVYICIYIYTRYNKGNVVELECEYDPASRHDLKGVKQGHLSWVSNGVSVEFRLYSHLFRTEFPESDNFLNELEFSFKKKNYLIGDSEIITHGYVDQSVVKSKHERFQFERVGFFVRDNIDCKDNKPGILFVYLTRNKSKCFFLDIL
ncbi:glutamine-tRNA ligase, partial [Reticulomyxa filosa]